MVGGVSGLEAAFKASRHQGVAAVEAAGGVTFEDLLTAVGSSVSDGGSWFCLAECLLKLVDRVRADWDSGLEALGRNVMENAVADASAALGAVLPSSPPALVGSYIAGEIRREFALLATGSPAIAAAHILGALLAIDDATNETFEDWLQAELRMTIEEGRAYPVSTYNPRIWMDGSANTRPSQQPTVDPLRKPAHVRLGTADHGSYRTVLDWDLKGRLLPLRPRKSLRIATLHAHEVLSEFSLDVDPDAGTAANLGPSDPVGAAELNTRLIGLADEAQASIIVIPEYCVSEPMRAALLDAVAGTDSIVVSVLGTGLSGRTNEALLAVGGPSGTVETKMIPKFTRAKILTITEDADVGRPTITIWRADGLSLAVLTCRDAADQTVIRILGEAGVSICLVPSFTDRLVGITGQVELLATTAQTWVAVAAAPREFGSEPAATPKHEAFFRGPFGDDRTPASYSVPQGHEAPLPGIWVFDSRGSAPAPGRVRYVPLPQE